MKHTIRQVFHSGKFVVGFTIMMVTLFIVFVYPLVIKDDPLQIIGQGTFFPPGIYVNTFDAVNAPTTYSLNLDAADVRRIANKLTQEDRVAMKEWLVADGIPENQIDIADAQALLALWQDNYDPKKQVKGMTLAKARYYQRVNDSLQSLLSSEGLIIASNTAADGLKQSGTIQPTDYVNVGDVANVRILLLGTDNFGRDVTTQLVKATGVSLLIGLIAGLIATAIGLTLGLLAGYVGGRIDDFIMFFTNLFTVIPSIVILILVSYAIGQDQRGPVVIAILIGITSWTWVTRSVRAQVMSLRNRDHVNLSKLSGHSLVRIIATDILPYIASYVVMGLILLISGAILAEASLAVLGLGPRTTETPTLGLMMNWALIYQAPTLGKWWAFFPVLFVIAMITFSMNLMNTGLDQVFNPTLRD
jgi:peptide/nickel transport system permease protein